MFNVTVIKIKDILKYFLTISLAICLIYFATKKINNSKQNLNIDIGKKIENKIEEYSTKLIEINLPKKESIYNNKNEEVILEENIEDKDFEIAEKMFDLQLGFTNFNEISKSNNKDTNQNIVQNIDIDLGTEVDNSKSNKENITFANENTNTEIVTTSNIAESYNTEYNNVKIKNETNFNLDENILNCNNLEINTSNIIIFHTHTCESYTSSEKYSYEPTGNFRTTDLNYTVAKVGDELGKYLTAYNFNVLHDKTYHDYPAYTGSYTRSLNTVQNLLGQMNSDIIIDLHRDAIGSNSNYDPTVKIGDDYAAQIMFVMGSNGGGLTHSNWQENLKFAIKIQQKANELYPNLCKPIIFRNSRYNQHLGKAACIIEVGATGNTLEQCLNSMKYLSKVMNEALH